LDFMAAVFQQKYFQNNIEVLYPKELAALDWHIPVLIAEILHRFLAQEVWNFKRVKTF
jgi:hypothetical protein